MVNSLGTGWTSVIKYKVSGFFRNIIFGKPLATSVALEHRLPILFALPVFASDALSSVAYGTEEILRVLAPLVLLGGLPAAGMQIFITLGIAILMIIVAASYRQAIHLYPAGGGSYSVARDNLGVAPGLIAAAALVIDYILTVAVSVSAGVFAFTSMLSALRPYKIEIAIVLVLIITMINLRGTKESGWVFAIPAYSFMFMIGALLATALYHYFTGTVHPLAMTGETARYTLPPDAIRTTTTIAGWFALSKAFSNGCSAMTGVEAVSNGVSAFQPPEAKNAAKTLLILISILVVMFIGVGFAALVYHAIPSMHETESVISQVARAVFGQTSIAYFIIQVATTLILMVAANTSFAGFPRLLSIVAKDGYAPKAFNNLGDRLVYNQGILALMLVSLCLVVGFRAEVSKLIPLYAIGVFLCFTFSQLGMVRKVMQLREKGWQRMVVVNGLGAVVTGAVTIVVGVSKFMDGAYMVVVLIPILVGVCYLIKRHYDWFDSTMTVHDYDFNPLSEPAEPLTVLVLVSSDIHRGILEGLECGRAITEGHPNAILRAVHIEMDPEKTPRLRAKWEQFVEPFLSPKIKLDVIPSPYRWLIEPILDYLDWIDLERTGDRVIVVLPEFETGGWITQFLHNFTARRLRTALLNRPHVTVVSSRFFMKPMAWRLGRGGLVY